MRSTNTPRSMQTQSSGRSGVISRNVCLAAKDRPPGCPSTVTVDLKKYDFHKVRKEDSVNPLPDDVVKLLHETAERRLMALGSFYKYLQVPEDELKTVEAEIRKAKHFEVLTLMKNKRQAELTALHDLVKEDEGVATEAAQHLVVESQLLRSKALKVLQREMEYVRQEEQMRLEEDRRAILVRERGVLLDRRRAFEQSNAAVEASPSGANDSKAGSHPVLVMNVALGNGREEKIVVRRNDDPSGVALQFVKKHHLPDHTVNALANQIRTNLTHHLHASTGRVAVTPTRRGARSPVSSSRR